MSGATSWHRVDEQHGSRISRFHSREQLRLDPVLVVRRSVARDRAGQHPVTFEARRVRLTSFPTRMFERACYIESNAMPNDPSLTATLDELWRDGVLQRYGERYETTRRWRAARHRASTMREPASERNDLRNPIVQALLAFYGNRHAVATLGPFVTVLFTFESASRGSPNKSR